MENYIVKKSDLLSFSLMLWKNTVIGLQIMLKEDIGVSYSIADDYNVKNKCLT